MSKFDYDMSRVIGAKDYPFYSLVMAAMRQADTENLERLKEAFPLIWNELSERYNAPGGFTSLERALERHGYFDDDQPR